VTRLVLATLSSALGIALAPTLGLALPGGAAYAGTPGVHHVRVPAAARAVDSSHPDRVVGHGTPASCTSAAVVRAVGRGGVITFDCGPRPVTIPMKATARARAGSRVVLDGGGLVTLDGGGERRILENQHASPLLVVQHLTLAHGDSTRQRGDHGAGGAILARGGRLKIVDTTFRGNRCGRVGPDLGGAAVRALEQTGRVYVVGSTFRGGRCSNGAGLSSIGVSWSVLNSRFVGNRAIGRGANPPRPGTPGGGSGGAIYLDGNRITLDLGGTLIRDNHAKEGGGAIFFVSNDRTGSMRIRHSTLRHNPSDGFETAGLPGIFYLGRPPTVTDSVLR
jgi:hypothetical protein